MTGFDQERDLRAAEYVLGVLDDDARAQILREAETDPALARAITAWENRLAPLSQGVAPVASPPTLWPRIAAEIGRSAADPMPTESVPASLWPRIAVSLERERTASIVAFPAPPNADITAKLRFWQRAAAAAMTLAAGLGAIQVIHPTLSFQPARAASYEASIVSNQGSPPCWLARADSNGRIVMTALCQTINPPDKDLELWAVARGSAKPIPLGILSGSGKYVTPDASLPLNHLSLLVSLESKGGSLDGRPNGPVLYGGELSPLE